jgi:hypothetical protein
MSQEKVIGMPSICCGIPSSSPQKALKNLGASARHVATCFGLPLEPPMFVVTVAFRGPVLEGGVSMLTVSDVAVATVTEPTAPLSNVTVFADGTPGTKPVPLMVIRDASCEKVAVLAVTVGAAIRPGGVTIRFFQMLP